MIDRVRNDVATNVLACLDACDDAYLLKQIGELVAATSTEPTVARRVERAIGILSRPESERTP